MNAIASSVLGPVVSCPAPVSRPLASLVNRSMQKSSVGRIQLPVVLDFHSDDGREKIRNWYNEQPETRFWKLKLRKDVNGQFKHEFIVVHLGSPYPTGAVCRFDRRAQEDMRGHALKHEGTTSEDSAHVITPADTKGKTGLDKSEVVLSVDFHEEQDLKYILAVCYGIQLHPNAKSYSLLRYNCYFFCWTLVTTMARRVSYWILSEDPSRLWRCIVGHLFHEFILGESWTPGTYELDLTPKEKCIYDSMKEKLLDRSLAIPPDDVLEKILLKNQLYPMLRNTISLALKEGGRIGMERLTANIAKTRGGNLLDPLDSKGDSQNESISFVKKYALSNMVSNSWFSSRANQRTLQKAQKKAQKISTSLHDKLITYSNISIEPVLEQPECYYVGYSFRRPPSTQKRGQAWHVYDYPIEDEIRGRMANHFKQVESYGFGSAKELIEQAEKTMIEIWESVFDMMKDESRPPFL